jgi:hypothetical protein
LKLGGQAIATPGPPQVAREEQDTAKDDHADKKLQGKFEHGLAQGHWRF